MTRLVLRLLLLAVFFNTAIGLPAHEAGHLPHASELAAAWQADDDGPAPDGEAHEACEWCHAFAQALAMNGPPADGPPPAVAPDRFAPPGSALPVRSARPWAFASRDPPRA